MFRFLYATVIGVVGAGLIHLAVILLLPLFSSNDVWQQIEAQSQPYEIVRLDGRADRFAAARVFDPNFAVFACRFNLADGVFWIRSPGNIDYWSVAVFDDRGAILFSANDRIAATKAIDLSVALQPQIRFLRQNPKALLENSIMTGAARREGFAVVRIFRPDPSWEPVVERFASQMRCTSLPV
ncbi:DUF1254 domain-containing protein [Oricola sp.]|uniref:DUF1254 domain-containing protein n=1 Tax=Oricola sp. TaxID=1979950 RepID=UPI003BA9BD14